MKNARAALLFSVFDPRSRCCEFARRMAAGIEANAMTPAGRERIAAFLIDYLGEEARGRPTFHHVPDHVFGDQKAKVVSLINLASLRDYDQRSERRDTGGDSGPILVQRCAGLGERDWIGREFQMGGAVLRVLKGTTRCPATEVNPETGERDADPVAELRSLYGHVELGVHAEVVEGGKFSIGDAMELMEI